MKAASYFTALVLSVLCLILCGGVMTLAFVNERQQERIQLRQQELSRGMMGPEARQISNQVLRDLGAVAQRNAALRRVLAKHGYEVARPAGAADETPRPVESTPAGAEITAPADETITAEESP